MFKLTANWLMPDESQREAFEQHYWSVHVPIAEKGPGLKKMVLTLITHGVEGAQPPFYRVAELYWDDEGAFARCEASPEWTALREDAGGMIERFGVGLVMGIGSEDYSHEAPFDTTT